MVMPSGWRSSDPYRYQPSASSAPSSTASVVAENRPGAARQALEDRLARRLALFALGLQREVDHHDGVLLDDADMSSTMPMMAMTFSSEPTRISAGGAPTPAEGKVDQDRHQVYVAFIKYAEHDARR